MIFDCDGTLVDSEYLNNLAVVAYLHQIGLMQYDLDYSFKAFMGKSLPDIMDMVAHENNIPVPPDYQAEMVRIVQEGMAEHLKPIENASAVVEACYNKVKICVGSNGERPNVLASLAATGLDQWLPEEHVFTKEQVARAKPAPDLYLFAAEQRGVSPDRTLVIEDSVPGAMAGKAAGMKVVGFTGVHHEPELQKEALKAIGVDYIIDNLIHIPGILEAGKD